MATVVVVVVVIVVNVVVVVVAHAVNTQLWSINFHLMPLKAHVECLWWVGWGGVCKVIFMSNQATVEVRLGGR